MYLFSFVFDRTQTITYCYLKGPNQGNDVQHAKVDATIQEWQLYANIIFHKTDDQNATLRITFDKTTGSWSYVGKQVTSVAAGSPTMNLGWIDDESTTLQASDKGTILHEFGHVLGLQHEHQSPARGDTLTLNEDGKLISGRQRIFFQLTMTSLAVYTYYERTQNWSPALVKEEIIDVYNTSDVSNYSKLDLTSIMM